MEPIPMPLRGENSAPSFNGSGSQLLRFFEDLEWCAEEAKLSNRDRIKFALRYISRRDAELWSYLPESEADDYPAFRKAVIALYPEIDEDRLHSYADLVRLVLTQSSVSINSPRALGVYHREFLKISQFLLRKGRICAIERDRLYIQGFDEHLRTRVLHRFEILDPWHHPDDTYSFIEVYSQAVFLLGGPPPSSTLTPSTTLRASSVAVSTSPQVTSPDPAPCPDQRVPASLSIQKCANDIPVILVQEPALVVPVPEAVIEAFPSPRPLALPGSPSTFAVPSPPAKAPSSPAHLSPPRVPVPNVEFFDPVKEVFPPPQTIDQSEPALAPVASDPSPVVEISALSSTSQLSITLRLSVLSHIVFSIELNIVYRIIETVCTTIIMSAAVWRHLLHRHFLRVFGYGCAPPCICDRRLFRSEIDWGQSIFEPPADVARVPALASDSSRFDDESSGRCDWSPSESGHRVVTPLLGLCLDSSLYAL